MNPPPPPRSDPSNERYEMIARAAIIVRKELSLLLSDGQNLPDTDYDPDLENSINMITPEDLEYEIFLLRSFLEYFYSTRNFPFSDRHTADEFVSSCTPMSLDEFIATNQRLKNRYKMRLWKVCKKFQILETEREQHAFELGNRLWGSMSLELLNVNEEQQQQQQRQQNDESMASAEEEKNDKEKEEKGGGDGKEGDNKGDEKENGDIKGDVKEDGDNKGDEKEYGDNKDGVVGEYPLLKTNEFGLESVLKMPVVSKEAVEKGLVSFGEDKVKNWEKRWKELEIEELNAFLAKVNTIRHYAFTLMDELKGKTYLHGGAEPGR